LNTAKTVEQQRCARPTRTPFPPLSRRYFAIENAYWVTVCHTKLGEIREGARPFFRPYFTIETAYWVTFCYTKLGGTRGRRVAMGPEEENAARGARMVRCGFLQSEMVTQ
jgi:hypothetical protein